MRAARRCRNQWSKRRTAIVRPGHLEPKPIPLAEIRRNIALAHRYREQDTDREKLTADTVLSLAEKHGLDIASHM